MIALIHLMQMPGVDMGVNLCGLEVHMVQQVGDTQDVGSTL